MQSPHPPRPPHPPLPGSPGESDRNLAARLGGPHPVRHHAVALLLARHWRAARDYAVVCLASAGPTPQLVATAAFHEVLGRMAGGVAGGALRPQLLAAVRDIVRAWAADDVACATLPELRKPAGGRGLRARKPGTPERRQLAERAFRALPGASQCLLWHTEVEAEPINIPAGLLGIDPATATAALEQAREQFRTGCVRAHRELAPSRECRFYNRLLDVPMRRGGALLPDVRQHLTVCVYCRHAAETFGLFDDGLGLLLAETVLGWGARRYLDSRPGRGAAEESPCAPQAAPTGVGAGGRHRTGPGSRHRKAVVIGVGLTSLALLATVLVAKSWSDDNGVPAPGATWGAPAGHHTHPGGTGPRAATAPSAASAGEPVEPAHGGLRGLSSGRCLDVLPDGVRAGAGVGLAPCSSAASQQWSYQDDGLPRGAAGPSRCLAAGPGTKRVVPAACVVQAGKVVYDITVRGEILPPRYAGPALAPGTGDASARVVPAARDGSPERRWVLEPGAQGTGGRRPDAVQGGSDAPGSGQPGFSKGDGSSLGHGSSQDHGSSKGDGLSQNEGPTRGDTPGESGEPNETRIAQARADHGRRHTGSGSPARAVRAVHRALPPLAATVAVVPATVGGPLR
ncbi:ricin-type beta-trefoil lectin domain protein [Streptomyces sp. NPDC007856]|uniref:ricin-type beta-trefoil lectin domain protein n=1 Tax=Streptomyces sp. NPDC007856 TaxID=3364781 RepID=UPI0036A3ED96